MSDPAPRKRPSPGTCGFTIMELLVTIPIIALILLVVAVIMSTLQKAVGAGVATGDLLNHVQAIERVLRDDFRRLSADGFLVIRNVRWPPNVPADELHHADQILFFSQGPWVSEGGVEANMARIWYGHLSPDRNLSAPSGDAIDWMVGRHAMLLQPETSVQGARSIWDAQALAAGTVDVAYDSDLRDVRATLQSGTVPPGVFAGLWNLNGGSMAWRMALASQRVGGARSMQGIALEDLPSQVRLAATVLAGRCSEFQVEFAGDFESPVGIDTVQIGTTGHYEPKWYGGLYPSDYFDPSKRDKRRLTGNGQIDSYSDDQTQEYTAVFGFDRAATPWPQLLRITFTLHDANVYLHKRYLDGDEEMDGRRFEFVIQVPR